VFPEPGHLLSLIPDLLSTKTHLSGSRLIKYCQVVQQGRFSGPIRSDQCIDLPFLKRKGINIENSSFTGSLGIIYLHSQKSKINLLLSTGYRIPNLDDLAKIRIKGDQITFPNPKVEPEYSYNAELGFSKTFNGYIQLNGSYFVSLLTNVIVRVPYIQNGSDSILSPDGEWLNTYVNDNSNRGIIHGFNLNMISDLNSNISFRGTLNYTFGRDLTLDQPLAHIPPIFGKADFIYETKKFVHEFFIVYSGWKKIENMALSGEDNEEEGTIYGYPGWYTINFRTTYNATKNISVQFALENIINNMYKPFATAVAAPGINFIATLRVKV
jgi:hemoglobin/transferrin/lactoferrin receptor protein